MDATKKPSLFGQVLKRRKSRQSNFAPCVIDFDYAGDSAPFSHMINKRHDSNVPTNKSQLGFEMNLRTYKNTTEWNAYKPFSFPSKQQFSPRKQYTLVKKDVGMLNAEYKKKFNDKFTEANVNEIRHQFDVKGNNNSTV